MIKKLADRFFKWYCKEEYYPDIKGDLEELYQQQLLSSPKWKADWIYVTEIFLLLRLSLIKSMSIFPTIYYTAMLSHHIKIALRNMLKQKTFSTINIGGFSLGIAACILLVIYFTHELNYDIHYKNKDRLFRLTVAYKDVNITGVSFPAPLAKALVNDYPEIEKAGRSIPATWFNIIRKEGDQRNAHESGFLYVDPEVIEILEIPLISGNPVDALEQPHTIIISKRKAAKYFPNEDPLGKTIIINEEATHPYTIKGVMENFPNTSHLQFDFLISLKGVSFWEGEQQYWGASMYSIYTLLSPETKVEVLEEKLSNISIKYMLPSFKSRGFADPEVLAENMEYGMQPVPDIYLNTAEIRDRLPHGDIQIIWLFAASAFLILLIASINFVNLSTARSMQRAKEVGIRKVVGAHKANLISQYLTESILFSLFAFILGTIIAYLSLPYFNQITSRSLVFPIDHWWFITSIVLAPLIIGFLTGLYPAFYLSSFQPVRTIKNQLSQGKKKSYLSSGLVLFQFVASIVLIICTLMIYQQMNFIVNKDIGYDKHQVLLIEDTNVLGDKISTFKAEIQQLKEVEKTTLGTFLPIEGRSRYGDSFWEKGLESTVQGVNGQIWNVDEDYIQTLGLTLLDGRTFATNMPSDSQSIIINQAMARALGFEDPLNKQITNKNNSWKIIGMIEDFHFESLKEKIQPLCFVLGHQDLSVMSVRFQSNEIAGLISSINNRWEEFAPHQPFRYTFLDESYALMHEDVQRSGQLFNLFSVLSILIACLGLFGLTGFVAEQRTKEIGIRKVLGASLSQIVGLLSGHFLLLTTISIFIAIPISHYLISYWLENFAYRVNIGWWIFIIAGMITLGIAFLTMSFHFLKAALANPIQSLRTE